MNQIHISLKKFLIKVKVGEGHFHNFLPCSTVFNELILPIFYHMQLLYHLFRLNLLLIKSVKFYNHYHHLIKINLLYHLSVLAQQGGFFSFVFLEQFYYLNKYHFLFLLLIQHYHLNHLR